jgi:succinate dehydrogenase / fumarate reductase cytochrome b subunit
MLVSGLVIAAFIVYHLAHFTALLPGINGVGDFSKLKTELHGEQVRDVYGMMILGFQVGWVALFYLIAQALLFIHLGHGLAAMFQSFGLRDHNWWPRIQLFAKAASVAIFIGYAVIPASIYMRVVGADYAEKVKHSIVESAAKEAK